MALTRRSTGFIAESVATLLLGDVGLDVFAQIVTLGVHGVDLLALAPRGPGRRRVRA